MQIFNPTRNGTDNTTKIRTLDINFKTFDHKETCLHGYYQWVEKIVAYNITDDR